VPSAKASRLRRKQRVEQKRLARMGAAERDARVRLTPEHLEALDAARVERDSRLGSTGQTFGKKIAELQAEWAAERRQIWADYEERRSTVLGHARKQAA